MSYDSKNIKIKIIAMKVQTIIIGVSLLLIASWYFTRRKSKVVTPDKIIEAGFNRDKFDFEQKMIVDQKKIDAFLAKKTGGLSGVKYN
jgi:hypothetical protein